MGIKLVNMIKDFTRKSEYELIDKYVIQDGKRHKCAIICPGGGYYCVCSFIEGEPIAKALNKMGISAFILYYRVKAEAHYPNPQDDLARAIKTIYENKDKYMLDMENYSIWGSSAGGHLVGSFGTTTIGYSKYQLPKPGALILSYPVISLEKEITHEGTRMYHIGQLATKEDELTHSVYTNVDENYPATYIWCGDADDTVLPKNTILMEEKLKKYKIPYVCNVFPGVKHGVGLGEGTSAEGWLYKAVEFWMSDKKTEV